MQAKKPESALRALAKAVAAMRDAITDEAGIVLIPGVDTLARLNAITSDLEKLNTSAKAETKAAMEARGMSHMEGVFFVCDMRQIMRATIDTQRLRADLPEVVAQYENQTPQVSLTFKAKGA